MKSILFSMIFFFIGVVSFCQQSFVNGLIVTQGNDTIMCLVPSTFSFENKVSIKRTSVAKKETILVSDIKYLSNGQMVFENIKYEKNSKGISKLMWIEEEGKLNLYGEIKADPDFNLSIIEHSQAYSTKNVKTYVIKKNDSTYYISRENFTEVIKPLIADAPNIVSKVESEDFNYNNIKELVEEYNKLF